MYLINFILNQIASAATTPSQSNTLNEIGDQIESALSSWSSKFFEFVGVQNKEELTDKVINEGKSLGTQLEGLAAELTAKAKQAGGTLEGPAQDFANKLEEAAKKLAAENPALVEEGKKVTENIQSEVQNVYKLTSDFTKNLADESGPVREELNSVLKKILESTKTAVTDISNSVDKATKSQ